MNYDKNKKIINVLQKNYNSDIDFSYYCKKCKRYHKRPYTKIYKKHLTYYKP